MHVAKTGLNAQQTKMQVIANNLSKDEKTMLLDQAYDLGENLLEENKIIDRKSLMENLKKGYPQFQIDADINEEMSF